MTTPGCRFLKKSQAAQLPVQLRGFIFFGKNTLVVNIRRKTMFRLPLFDRTNRPNQF